MGPSGLADLHEREGDTALLAESLARGRDSAALVVVEGPPGIGKTSLLGAARELARESGTEVLGARASELESHAPFGVVRQLLEPVVLGADAERRERRRLPEAARASSGSSATSPTSGRSP